MMFFRSPGSIAPDFGDKGRTLKGPILSAFSHFISLGQITGTRPLLGQKGGDKN